MKFIYEYHGNINKISFSREIHDITLHVPTALFKYINHIGNAANQEKYSQKIFRYDSQIYLYEIMIPSNLSSIPAKIITLERFSSNEFTIFGPVEPLEKHGENFASMSQNDYSQYLIFREKNSYPHFFSYL